MDKENIEEYNTVNEQKAFEWGDLSVYSIIQPITRKEKNEAIKA